jgi:hypothetical protein
LRIAVLRFAQSRGVERAVASDRGVTHENNFVAKMRDSESAQALRGAIARGDALIVAPIARNARVQKDACRIGFSCSRASCRHRCCAMLLRSQMRTSPCRQIKRGWRRRFAASTLP